MRLECEPAIDREISDYFTFETPNAKFMQRRAQYRRWDGKIRLYKLKDHLLYRGLLPRLIEFASQRGYAVTNLIPPPVPLYSVQELDSFIINEQSKILNMEIRDYQHAALRELCDEHRGIILSPTGSGKSFVIYLTQLLMGGRSLVVVPTIGLVSQMTADFASYGCDVDTEVHQIQAGRAKESDKNIFISTWQSVYQQDAEWFHQFDCVIVDEVHLAKAKSLTHLMEQCTKTAYRFGFTGTLDDTQAHQLILEGLFGKITRVATTDELIKRKQLSPIRIKMIVVKYPEGQRRLLKSAAYQDELEAVVTDLGRLKLVTEMAANLKGNTLILFNFVEKHGIPLYEQMKTHAHKNVHYIAGSVDGDDREVIRNLVEQGEDQVIVASFGTFSTGINITNLRRIVFASPSKSKYRVLQSIGRTSRLHKNKSHADVIDLVDDLRIGKYTNYLMKHAEERMRFYAAEKFPVTLHEVRLEDFTKLTTDSPDGLPL